MKDSKSKIRADITSKESEARIKSIFRSTPIGIGVVSNRIIIEVNERFCEMTGYKKSELIGQNSRIIYSSDKEFERVGKYKYEQIKKYGTGSIETQFRRKDGKIIDIILSSTPIDPNDLSVGITFTALDITQRKQAEQKCQESERNFRDLVEKSNIAILIDDIGGNFTYFNEIFTKLFGYSTEEIKEKSIHSLVHPDDIDRVIKFHRERIQGKKNPTRYEFKGVKKDGSIIYLEVDVVNLKDGKNIIGTRSYLWDISDRKQVEIELRKSEEKYKSIVEYSSDSIYIIDDTNIILSANQAAVKMLGSTPQKIIGKNLSDIFPRENAKTFKRNLKKIFVTGEPANYESEISFGTQTIWLDTSLNPMNDYAGKVYAIMGVSRDITERKQADETLRKSEEQLRIITDNTNDNIAITTFDLKATYIYVNPSIKQVLGYNPEDLLGESFFDYIHPDDKKVLLPIIKKYITKKIKGLLSDKNISITETIEFRFKNKLGNWRHMQSTVNLIDNQLLAITRDITEQKLAEIALRESEEFNKRLIASSNDCIKVLDLDGNLLSMSSGGQKLLEIDDITPYLNKSWTDFWKGEDNQAALKAILVAKKGAVGKFSGFCETEKGTPKWWDIIVTPIKDTNGKLENLLAISRDITERKQIEENLELSENRLMQAQKVAKMGHYNLILKTGMWTSSKSLDNIFGIDENFKRDLNGSLQIIHPDFRDIVANYFRYQIINKQRIFDKELKIVNIKTKQEKWVHGLGTFKLDKNKRVIEIFGTIHDITERKKAEDALRNSEEYLSNLMSSISDPIFTIKMPERVIEFGNDAVSDLFGYSRDEYIGKPTSILYESDTDFNNFGLNLQKALKNNIFQVLQEQKLRTKKGEIIWAEINTTFLFDNNKLDRVISIVRNMTERKKAEDALKESEKKFRTLVRNVPGVTYRCDYEQNWTMRYLSNKIEDLSGFPATDFIENRVRTYASIIHPDDRKMVEDVAFGSVGKNKPYNIEYRIIHANGDIRWISEDGQGIFDDKNDVSFLDGVLFDITERKHVELELTKHHEHLEELVKERTAEIEEKNINLQRFHDATINREFRIKELRDEIEKLKSQLNR